jgi:hypothetical protein
VHVRLAMRVVLGRLVVGIGMLTFVLILLDMLAFVVVGIDVGMRTPVRVRLPHPAFTRPKQGQTPHLPQLDDLGIA